MSHPEQVKYCMSVKQKFPQFFSDKLVVDVGSLDINGNNQYLFENCLYLGVDVLPGRNVDFAVKGHELGFPEDSVDVFISTECFEHDQFYPQTIKNIIRMLKPGGLLLFTCATVGRPEHGTRRTTPADAPLLQSQGEWGDYYKNLEEGDIRSIIDVDSIFEAHSFSLNTQSHDLYFWGIKRGVLSERKDYSFQISPYASSDIRRALADRIEEINRARETINGLAAEIEAARQAHGVRDKAEAELRATLEERLAEVSRARETINDLIEKNERYERMWLIRLRNSICKSS